jgi:DNA-directed RNA polymerase subunit RPC12/RpoP
MVLQEFKCMICGRKFEAKVLDDQDPKERACAGSSLRCPGCSSTVLNVICTVRRMAH